MFFNFFKSSEDDNNDGSDDSKISQCNTQINEIEDEYNKYMDKITDIYQIDLDYIRNIRNKTVNIESELYHIIVKYGLGYKQCEKIHTKASKIIRDINETELNYYDKKYKDILKNSTKKDEPLYKDYFSKLMKETTGSENVYKLSSKICIYQWLDNIEKRLTNIESKLN